MDSNSQDDSRWTQVITPRRSFLDLRLKELFRYRDLIFLFVKRDFVAFYKQTILGPLWYVIQPLSSSLIYLVIFTYLARISTEGMPPFLFYLSGSLVWLYFSETLNRTSETFVTNRDIFGKVYFPRLAIPVSGGISGLIQFSVQSVVFALFYAYYIWAGAEIAPQLELALLPLLILQMYCYSLGLGLIVSSLTTRYRDLQFTLRFGIQLYMFASPIVYPSTLVPEAYRSYYMLNPIAPITESLRFTLTGINPPAWEYVALGAGVTLAVFLLGLILFSRIERRFADTV